MNSCVVIETHNLDGVEWGVSYNGYNPEPHQYQKCNSKAEAWRLFNALQSAKCPQCGSDKILAPSASLPALLTCDPCGTDFAW